LLDIPEVAADVAVIEHLYHPLPAGVIDATSGDADTATIAPVVRLNVADLELLTQNEAVPSATSINVLSPAFAYIDQVY
jgi:hypothetical protein